MKIKVDIDCTPEEMRSFLGLPDVSQVQDVMLSGMRERMEEMVRSADAEALAKLWGPAGVQGLEAMQKMFWSMAGGKAPEARTEPLVAPARLDGPPDGVRPGSDRNEFL